MITPTKSATEFIQAIAEAKNQSRQAVANPCHVSELTSLPSFVYEKLRNIVDYKDEHLLRKNAIRRFLKRKFVLPQLSRQPETAARSLVRELILSRYLPNDSLPETIIPELGQVLTKYYALWEELEKRGCAVPRWREYTVGLAAVECDARLVALGERHAYLLFAYRLIKQTINLADGLESEETKSVQLMLAIQRTMERADRDIINMYLLRHYYPAWFTLPPAEAALDLGPQYDTILKTFTQVGNHKLGRHLQPLVKRLLVPLIIFRDMLRYDQTAWELIKNPVALERAAHETYEHFWQATRRRILRKGFHAMAYIFVTKMLLAVLLELPYEKFVIGAISYLPLTINLAFPALLMAVITLLIKSPGQANEARAVLGIKEMIYGGQADFFQPRKFRTSRHGFWKRFIYALLYIVTMGASLGAVVLVLWQLGFNPLSGTMFILFMSLVSFFGLALRQQARQLKVLSSRETMLGFLVDFFTLPVLSFGKWLATTFDRVNVFVFLLDFMFEVPFKSLLKAIEEWFAFLKEKKEEMY
ncbi:MAG: hypothetical protein HY974_00730 [Candidatus Kerfeldbacteria bacterium]|nr:hypothetical protein [Candidatus Kerfeldbacteria bacterium]